MEERESAVEVLGEGNGGERIWEDADVELMWKRIEGRENHSLYSNRYDILEIPLIMSDSSV